MKSNILIALRVTIISIVLCVGFYTILIWGLAQFAPNKGKGMVVSQNGKTYYCNIGQSFTEDGYFNSRPSAVNYNAAGSGGSNKGSNNAEYLTIVQARIDRFIKHNPEILKSNIPADMITASGSGLDPDISEAGARVQIKRISAIRKIDESKVSALIQRYKEKPLLGLFGPSKINVLKLNLALDQIK